MFPDYGRFSRSDRYLEYFGRDDHDDADDCEEDVGNQRRPPHSLLPSGMREGYGRLSIGYD